MACKVGPGDSRAGRNPWQKSSLPSGTGWLSQQYSLQVLVTGACLECQGEGEGQAHNPGRAAGVWAPAGLTCPALRPGHSLWALPPRAGLPAPDGGGTAPVPWQPRPHAAGPNAGAGDKTAQFLKVHTGHLMKGPILLLKKSPSFFQGLLKLHHR